MTGFDEFIRWCSGRQIAHFPATPAHIVVFIYDQESLGIEALSNILDAIASQHAIAGLADPTLGYPVAPAMNRIARLDPPRSWPKDKKAMFPLLPYPLQVYLDGHERKRDVEVRRAQSELAEVKRKQKEAA